MPRLTGKTPFIPTTDSETCPGIMKIANIHSTDQVISQAIQVINVATGQVMEVWGDFHSAVVLALDFHSAVVLALDSRSAVILALDSRSAVVLALDSRSAVVMTGCLFRTLAAGDIRLDSLYRPGL